MGARRGKEGWCGKSGLLVVSRVLHYIGARDPRGPLVPNRHSISGEIRAGYRWSVACAAAVAVCHDSSAGGGRGLQVKCRQIRNDGGHRVWNKSRTDASISQDACSIGHHRRWTERGRLVCNRMQFLGTVVTPSLGRTSPTCSRLPPRSARPPPAAACCVCAAPALRSPKSISAARFWGICLCLLDTFATDVLAEFAPARPMLACDCR